MSNEDKILELLQRMEGRFDSIEGRLDKIEERLEAIEEKQEIMNEAIGTILEWADDVHETKGFPIPRIG